MEDLKKENEEQKGIESHKTVETKSKKKGKCGKRVLKATAITLTAVALVGGGVFIGTELIPKEYKTNKENNTNVNISSNSMQEEKVVTDAFNNLKKYSNGQNYIEYKFRIPKININSSYASEINKELDEKLISVAKRIIEIGEVGALLETDYDYFENGDIISVIAWGKYEGGASNYYVYNINKKTGLKVANEEILKIKNMDKVTFENKLSNALGIDFKNANGDYSNWIQTQGGNAEDTKKFYERQYNLTIYSDNCKLENQKIYLGDNEEIFVVGKSYNLAGAEYSNHIIDLENIKLVEKDINQSTNKNEEIKTVTKNTNNTTNNNTINSINDNVNNGINNNVNNSGNNNANNSINTNVNNSENNVAKNDVDSVGISEIKKCLKDREWLKNNVFMKKNCFGNNIEGNQTLTFMKIKAVDKNAPMVAIKATSERDLSREVFLVSYNDGKVTSKSITGFAMHISHADVQIDPNNQMANNTYFHMGVVKDSYINLKNSNPEFLDSIGYYFELDENGVEKKSNFSKHYGLEENDTNITEIEYNNLKSKYNNYKFYDITTELTDSNIDKYLK